jgi:Ca-activated chloride channel homolog
MIYAEKRLVEVLKDQGLISQIQIEKAVRVQRNAHLSVPQMFVDLGYINDEDLARATAIAWNLEYITMDDPRIPTAEAAEKLAPRDLITRYFVLPLCEGASGLHIVMSNPDDLELLDLLSFRLNKRIIPVVASRRAIKSLIEGNASNYEVPRPQFSRLSSKNPNDRIALFAVNIASRITGLCQHTFIEHIYCNLESSPIEAWYTFPLPDAAAVIGFEVITNGRVLTGVVEELETAIQTYQKKIAQGHGAYMLERHRSDVFSAYVGNLLPRQLATLRLTYVSPLKVDERRLRVTYPTTLTPRYHSAKGMDPLEAMITADALNAPHQRDVPYQFSLMVDFDMGVPIDAVKCPCYPISTTSDALKPQVTLTHHVEKMDREIVLDIQLSSHHAASARVETGPTGEHFIAATFVPELSVDDMTAPAPADITFLLDCSGSMGGSPIVQAKKALELCLRTLNPGDHFNICRFGSSFDFFSPASLRYDETTLARALKYVHLIDADMGGTELYPPLEKLLQSPAIPGLDRQIVLLTDGAVSNEPGIIALARHWRGRARIFTFGIGQAVSQNLINGIAQASWGAPEFISEGESIQDKVLRQFGRMASPAIMDVKIHWPACDVDLAAPVPALFDGGAVTVYGRFQGSPPREAQLTGKIHGRLNQWTIPVHQRPANGHSTIAPMWALSRMENLEDKPQEQIALSKKYGVLCSLTTFLAIEHRSQRDRTLGMPELRRIPLMFPHGTNDARGWNTYTSQQVTERIRTVSVDASIDVSCDIEASLNDSDKERAPHASYASQAAEPDLLLTQLLTGQSAGGWLAKHPGIETKSLNSTPWDHAPLLAQARPLSKGNDQALWTAITLVALAKCFADQKPLWQRAFKKALRCLTTHQFQELADWVAQATR